VLVFLVFIFLPLIPAAGYHQKNDRGPFKRRALGILFFEMPAHGLFMLCKHICKYTTKQAGLNTVGFLGIFQVISFCFFARTLTSGPKGCKFWPPNFGGILFPALGPMERHKVQHLLVLGAD
jgi:hypothetical protein